MKSRKIYRHMRKESLPLATVVNVNMRVLLFNIMLFVVGAVFLTYYVVQANALSALQYDIGEYGKEIVVLRESHDTISMEIASLERPDSIVKYALSAGMILATDASYVSISDASLAGR